MKTCLKCGNPLPEDAISCGYCGAPVVAEKKNNKPLLFGLIGGGAALILVIVLCFIFLCGGSVEFGMSFNDAHDALVSDGFLYSGGSYRGEIDDLGYGAVYFDVNPKQNALSEIYFSVDAEVDAVTPYMEEELGLTCEEYDATEVMYDDGEEIYEDVSVFVGENEQYYLIIHERYGEDLEDGTYTSVQVYAKEFITKSDKKEIEDRIEMIEDGEDEEYYY